MGKRAEDYISERTYQVAQEGGAGIPLWYVGGGNSVRTPRKKTFEDLVAEVEAEKNLGKTSLPSEVETEEISE